MKTTLLRAALLSLATMLSSSVGSVEAGAAGAVPIPDYAKHPLPIASTFYWFSSVEVGVCYSPKARVGSIKGAIHCTHQENYDIDNNTWTLPQTCVALKPLGGPLSSAVRDSCTNAKGTFNIIKPAASNGDGGQAYNAIQNKNGGAGTGDGSGDGGSASDSNDQEDADKKKSGGMLGGLGGLIGL